MTPALSSIPDRSEAEAREDIARRDRATWFPGLHASGDHGVISGRDGREVCRCAKVEDRDAIVMMARAHDALVDAVESLVERGTDSPVHNAALRALALARGATKLKTVDEIAGTPRGIL